MVPVIRDAGRLTFPQLPRRLQRPDRHARARTSSPPTTSPGANVSLTNPGGIGTVASVPRLMAGQGTIVATGSIAYPVGLGDDRRADRRREGHDDDLDLRPPHHPGRRVGPLPAGRRGVPPGRARLLRGRSSRRSASSSARRPQPPQPRPPRAAAAPRRQPRAARPTSARRPRSCCRPCRPRSRCSRRTARTATSPRGSTRSAPSPRATRRSTPSRSASRPSSWRRIPAQILRIARAGRDARRRAAAPARDLLRHDRLRDRAHRLPPPARVAAREDRVRRVPHAADRPTRSRRCCAA